jgi:hypothetical protein
MIGNPTECKFEGLVRERFLSNCPVTISDVRHAHQIFGPDLAGLRGKTVHHPPLHVQMEYIDIPLSILDNHRNVTVTADVMFVNGLPFLITASRGLNLVTIEYASPRTASNIAKLVNCVYNIYAAAGLKLQTLLMDMEFEPLKALFPHSVINTIAANEHVLEIERKIRIIKERARGTLNTLPFAKLPKLIIIELLWFITMWLNSFPVKNGLSRIFSPREILVCHRLNAKLHCCVPFGAYCEVHDEPSPSNSMQRRTHGAIHLGPSGNLQGNYHFFCLDTGK